MKDRMGPNLGINCAMAKTKHMRPVRRRHRLRQNSAERKKTDKITLELRFCEVIKFLSKTETKTSSFLQIANTQSSMKVMRRKKNDRRSSFNYYDIQLKSSPLILL